MLLTETNVLILKSAGNCQPKFINMIFLCFFYIPYATDRRLAEVDARAHNNSISPGLGIIHHKTFKIRDAQEGCTMSPQVTGGLKNGFLRSPARFSVIFIAIAMASTLESPRNRSKTLDSTSSSGSTDATVSMETLLSEIVHDQLGLHSVDLPPIIQKFHDNWIYELKILQTLEREQVVRLQLPIAVRT
jgi:hypothetical protein